MSFIEALLLAVALCVDSLVVSATLSVTCKPTWRQGIGVAVVFGICQGLFPLVGALLGGVTRTLVESVGHWIAFALLLIVGMKMVVDGCRKGTEEPTATKLSVATVLMLGVATSIDALAVGIGLGIEYMMATVVWVVVLIGVVTMFVSLIGYWLGRSSIAIPERTANIVAGLVLIGLGVKALLF